MKLFIQWVYYRHLFYGTEDGRSVRMAQDRSGYYYFQPGGLSHSIERTDYL